MERHKGLRRQGERVRKARLPEDRLQAGHSQEARRQEGSLPMGHSQEARRQGARLRTDHFQEGPFQAVPLPEVRLQEDLLREDLLREDRAVPPRDHPAAGFQTALPGFCAICWTSFIWTTWTPETCWFWRCCFSSFERRRTRSCW